MPSPGGRNNINVIGTPTLYYDFLYYLSDGKPKFNTTKFTAGVHTKKEEKFDFHTLKRKRLNLFYNTTWPQYKLGNEEVWLRNGSLNYNTILQLDILCLRQCKWTEILYVQSFMVLRNNSKLHKNCKVDPILLAAITKTELNLDSDCPFTPMVPQQQIAPKIAPSTTESTSQGEDKTINCKDKQSIPP